MTIMEITMRLVYEIKAVKEANASQLMPVGKSFAGERGGSNKYEA